MSGIYTETLKRRASILLSLAERVEDSGLAMFFVEQALQLHIKAVHYELFGGGFVATGFGSSSSS